MAGARNARTGRRGRRRRPRHADLRGGVQPGPDPLFDLFGAGDSQASLVSAAKWVSRTESLLAGLLAGLLAFGYLHLVPPPGRPARPGRAAPRWPAYLLAGAGPGLLLLLAEVIIRIGGRTLLDLAGALSEADAVAQTTLGTSRVDNGIWVLFVGRADLAHRLRPHPRPDRPRRRPRDRRGRPATTRRPALPARPAPTPAVPASNARPSRRPMPEPPCRRPTPAVPVRTGQEAARSSRSQLGRVVPLQLVVLGAVDGELGVRVAGQRLAHHLGRRGHVARPPRPRPRGSRRPRPAGTGRPAAPRWSPARRRPGRTALGGQVHRDHHPAAGRGRVLRAAAAARPARPG